MSKTLVLQVDSADLGSPASLAALRQVADVLRSGGTVAFPTETVYGLGANALDASAVERIFAAKQRPSWDPLIVHIAAAEDLNRVAFELTEIERELAASYWPGPLTLLLPRSPQVPAIVTAGRDKVGVRIPAHPVARALIALAQVPVAAPSANSFGRTSPTTAQHVLEDLDGRVDLILDGGATTLGLESTVLDARTKPPLIYRPGMVSLEALRLKIPEVAFFVPETPSLKERPEALPSPGVGIRHYAPRARLVLVEPEQLSASVGVILDSAAGLVGILLPDGMPGIEAGSLRHASLRIFPWGNWGDGEQLARRLFLGLRELDTHGVGQILCPIPTHQGVGAALRDRLTKAAKQS